MIKYRRIIWLPRNKVFCFKRYIVYFKVIKGIGISRGLGSVVEVFEGKDKGKLFVADIGGGIRIKGSTDKVPEVSRVVYDITTKPPATMEWE